MANFKAHKARSRKSSGGKRILPANVILVGENDVAEQMLRLQDADRTVDNDAPYAEEEMTDDEEDGTLSSEEENMEEEENLNGRCYEEGEIESDDELGESGELLRHITVFQSIKEVEEPDKEGENDGQEAEDLEEEPMVEKGTIKLRLLASKKIRKCQECPRQFVSAKSLQNHMRVHMDTKKKIPCRFCSEAFATKEFYHEHLKSHEDVDFFACKECGKKFSNKEYLEMHEPSHEGMYPCTKCDKKLMTKKSLRLHKMEHVASGPGKRGRPRKIIPIVVGNGHLLYKCEQCGKMFSTLGILKTHRLIHAQENYRCEDCDKSFTTLAYLKQHLKSHDKSRSYMCQFCGKTFVEPWYCKRHELTHTDKPALQCQYCNAGFSVITTFRRHLRTHTGEKPFVCSFCGKSFTENGTLRRHERTHTGAKPYACQFCDKKFAVLHAMKRHAKTHDLVKAFPCKLCSRAYYDKGSLVRHEKSHKTPERSYISEQREADPSTTVGLQIVERALEGSAIEILTSAKSSFREVEVDTELQEAEESTIHLLTNVKHAMSNPSEGEIHEISEPVRTQEEYHASHHMIQTVPVVSHHSEVQQATGQLMHSNYMGSQMLQQVQLQDGRSVFATVFEKGAPGNWQVHVHNGMPEHR